MVHLEYRRFIPLRVISAASRFLHTALGRKAAGLNRLLKCVMVGFGLVCIRAGEQGERTVDRVTFA
jgi:hypothetical protein